MSFYKEIEPFAEYIYSIRKLKQYFSFDLRFPAKWIVPKNIVEDQIITPDNNNPDFKVVSFVAQINEEDITNVTLKIVKVIKINREKEIKEKLFKQTIEQLKQTFEQTDLEKLQTLYFDFDTTDINIELNSESDEQEPTVIELVGEPKKEGPKRTRKKQERVPEGN